MGRDPFSNRSVGGTAGDPQYDSRRSASDPECARQSMAAAGNWHACPVEQLSVVRLGDSAWKRRPSADVAQALRADLYLLLGCAGYLRVYTVEGTRRRIAGRRSRRGDLPAAAVYVDCYSRQVCPNAVEGRSTDTVRAG